MVAQLTNEVENEKTNLDSIFYTVRIQIRAVFIL